MELKVFVAETLKQIVEGAVIAQQDVKGRGATVNPLGLESDKFSSYTSIDHEPTGRRTVQMVEFEISLGETEGDEKGGRIAVFFGSVGVGAQAKSEAGSSAMNRVKFSVPIMLPSHRPGVS